MEDVRVSLRTRSPEASCPACSHCVHGWHLESRDFLPSRFFFFLFFFSQSYMHQTWHFRLLFYSSAQTCVPLESSFPTHASAVLGHALLFSFSKTVLVLIEHRAAFIVWRPLFLGDCTLLGGCLRIEVRLSQEATPVGRASWLSSC